jgi:hypothetical protein
MALFDTPSLLGKIWEKQTFPEGGGGLAGLVGGFTGGFSAGRDYKNTPKGERSFVGTMQEAAARGAENSAEISQPLHPLQRKLASQNLTMANLKIQEAIYNRDMAVKTREGMAKIGEVLSQGSFDDPATMQRALGIAAAYGIESEALQPVMKRFNDAQEYKNRSSLLENEYKLRMQLAEQEARARIEKDAAYQDAIMGRERMKQDEINRRQTEKLKAAQDTYQARLSYLREAGKNDPMLNSKERLFSAKAQAITRDEWAYETPEQVQEAIDKAYQDVFGNQSSLTPPAAAPETTNAPAASRKKYNPETGLLE